MGCHGEPAVVAGFRLLRLAFFCVIATAPVLLMTWRKRSATKALYSVVSWSFNAAGLMRGLLRPQRPAREAIASRIVRDAVMMHHPAIQGAAH